MPPPKRPLPRSFFERPVHQVARRLIGCLLVRSWHGELLVGRIVETEAYGGRLDPASHAYRGPTKRCRTMFGPRAHSYVYFTYGNHYCANVTAGRRDLACAVLLRAVEPIDGHATLRELRAAATSSKRRAAELRDGRADAELCNGPGKLAAAFGIDLDLDGAALGPERGLWIAPATRARSVVWTPRIGLGQNPAAPWLWRCAERDTAGATPIPARWPRAARPTPTLTELAERGA